MCVLPFFNPMPLARMVLTFAKVNLLESCCALATSGGN